MCVSATTTAPEPPCAATAATPSLPTNAPEVGPRAARARLPMGVGPPADATQRERAKARAHAHRTQVQAARQANRRFIQSRLAHVERELSALAATVSALRRLIE